MKLKRELGLLSTTLYGIGVIIGAGIYALIGQGAGIAGNMLWLSFLISAIIAIFSGLSYSELSSMFPKEAAEYTYTRRAFRRELLSFIVGWILAVGTAIAAATVALGFAGYFTSLFGGSPAVVAVCLLAAMTFLNYAGIRESSRFNNAASVLEVLGLLVIIALGLLAAPPDVQVNLLELPAGGFGAIMVAVSVIFFAYTGFEGVANIAEEVKNGREVVPKALLLALLISTALYILVSIAALREVGWEALSQSNAPLTLVASRALGGYAVILSLIAIFSTANTALIFLIVASRILYGMSHGGSLHPAFSAIGARSTPYLSVFAVGALAMLAAAWGDIKSVAQLTDLAVFIAYFAVNASLVALASSSQKHGFRTPRLAGIPVFAVLGAAASLAMLIYFEPKFWLMELGVVAAGLGLFLLGKRSG